MLAQSTRKAAARTQAAAEYLRVEVPRSPGAVLFLMTPQDRAQVVQQEARQVRQVQEQPEQQEQPERTADLQADTDRVKDTDTADTEQLEQLPDESPERSGGDLIARKARTVKDKAQVSDRAQDLEEEQ